MRTVHIRLFILTTIIMIAMGSTRPLPKLFVIGDSISVQYGPYLEKYLEGKVQYARKEDDGGADKSLGVVDGTQGGDSRMVLEYLKAKLHDPGFSPGYIMLNCGLHDIKRDIETQKKQVDEGHYRDNLKEIAALLKKRGINLIWVRITPVVESIHNNSGRSFHRYLADIAVYNRIADEIMSESGIPVVDLFNFTIQLGNDQSPDGVHFTESARSLQAAFIAGSIHAHTGK
jgi:lysophospholipase L1-like esterase